jgi:hypothetical protein
VGGANLQILHYFGHGYLEEKKSMIHSFTVTFGANGKASGLENLKENLGGAYHQKSSLI